jgi:hypothetical protein
VHSTSPVNSFTSGQSTAIPSRAHLSLQRVYSYPTLLALSRSSTSDGGPIKVFFRAILRPFILAAFVLRSGDGTAYPQVVCRVLQANDECGFRDNYHRHPLRTFTPLPVLFVVCATSSLPRLAHTIPPPNKVTLHLNFINSSCSPGSLQDRAPSRHRIRVEHPPFNQSLLPRALYFSSTSTNRRLLWIPHGHPSTKGSIQKGAGRD